MSIINDVRSKLLRGQNLFRRSTVEKILIEYDRLLMRTTRLEQEAAQQSAQPTAENCTKENRVEKE